jgi:hypothetical protein
LFPAEASNLCCLLLPSFATNCGEHFRLHIASKATNNYVCLQFLTSYAAKNETPET